MHELIIITEVICLRILESILELFSYFIFKLNLPG